MRSTVGGDDALAVLLILLRHRAMGFGTNPAFRLYVFRGVLVFLSLLPRHSTAVMAG